MTVLSAVLDKSVARAGMSQTFAIFLKWKTPPIVYPYGPQRSVQEGVGSNVVLVAS